MPPEVLEEIIDATTTVEAPAAPAVEEALDSEGDLWGNLDDSFDLDVGDDLTLDVTTPAPAPVVEEVPAQQPVPAEPVTPVTPEPVVAEAPQPPPAVEAEVPAWQPPVQPDPAQLEAVRSNYMQQLAQSYQLDEATAELVETNFSAAAPQLLSQVHMRVAESVTQTLGQMLPQLIAHQMQYMQVAQRSTDKFFGEWPELNKPEYQNTLAQVAQMYRQVRPQASPDEFVRDVGIQAWTALGLPVQQLLLRGQQQVQAAPAPQMQESFPQGGYAPATPGAPARSQRAPAARSDNVFTQFAEEFLQDGE